MNFARCSARPQRGFSLIEVMVAMVIGIVILLGLSQVFISNSRTSLEIDRVGRQIENGTYALQLLEDELTNAGFWGEAGAQSVGALSELCPVTVAELTSAMGYPVQGEGAGDCVDPKDGSDFIAVRRASTCAAGVGGCAALSAADINLQVAACAAPAAVEVPGEVEVAQGSADLTATQRDCVTTAPIYRFLSRAYYVDDNDVLTREELTGGAYVATPLVDGVEMLRFEYGLDTSAPRDGQVDSFTAAPVGTEWSDVVVVKLSLVARNQDPTLGYDDARTYMVGGRAYTVPDDLKGFKRQVYSTSVHLRNVSGRREQP